MPLSHASQGDYFSLATVETNENSRIFHSVLTTSAPEIKLL